MRKSYYTNGYTNDHDPTYYRDSYEQAPGVARVGVYCAAVADLGRIILQHTTTTTTTTIRENNTK